MRTLKKYLFIQNSKLNLKILRGVYLFILLKRRLNFQKTYEIYEKCLQNQHIQEPTLAWIHYIRFSRRHEDINAARKLFRRAREDPRSTYHLFVANANLEYFCTKVYLKFKFFAN